MATMNISKAKTRLSQWVDKAAAGEEVIISRNSRPMVRLARIDSPRTKVHFGVLAGKVHIAPDFDAAMPAKVLAGFDRELPSLAR